MAAIVPGPVGAQARIPPLDVLLARLMVAEAGWDPAGRYVDHAAIAHVLARRHAIRRDDSLRDTIHAYTAGRLRAPRRAWIAQLGAEPFPLAQAYIPRWRTVLERAQAFMRGTLPDPCPDALHWGAPYGLDLARARRAGFRRVCADRPSRNVLWAPR